MRHNRLGRALAAALLLWFACVAGAPEALHSCPVHSPLAASGGSETPGGHSHADHLPERADDPDRHSPHAACTCLGECSASGVAPGLPAVRPALAAAASTIVDPGLPRLDSPLPTAPAFLLPYANGPPGPARVA